MKEIYRRAVFVQSIPILSHWNRVIVHALGEPEPIPVLPAMGPFFFLLFYWICSQSIGPEQGWEQQRGESSWVKEFPIMSSFTWQPCRMHIMTTMHSSCLGADWGTRSTYWFTSCDRTRGEPIPLRANCCAKKPLLLTPIVGYHI